MPLDLSQVNLSALSSLPQGKPLRNPITAGLSSGVDQLQGLGYNAAAAVSDAVGLNRARDWLLDRATLNQFEAQENGRPDLEMVEDQDLSTALPFAAYQVSKQVPQIAAALGLGAVAPQAVIPAGLARGAAALPSVVGGGGLRAGMDFAARRAALQAGQRFAGNLTGGAALGTGMGAGALYGESVEAGDPSPYAALAAAPIYGVTEGLPTALLGGTLTKGAFRGALPTRMLKAGAVNAGTGATSEILQNEMEMGFNPNLTPEEIASRRLNSAVVGGLAEGTIGSLGGLRRPAQPAQLLPGANQSVSTPPAPPPAPPLQLGWSGYDTGVGPLVTFPDGSTMTRAEYERYVVNMPQGAAPLEAYQPNRPFQYEGAIPFTPTDLYTPQGPTRPSLDVPLVSGQGDLFNPLMEGMQPSAPAVEELGVAPSTEMGALFEAYPEALVRTEYGLSQIRAALRNANGGKLNAQLQRFIPEFSRAIEQGPAAVDALIAKYDTSKSTLAPEVFETAAQMAQDYQSRILNAQAAGGVRRARPGVTVGAAPNYEATADALYDTQDRMRSSERAAQGRQQLTGAIADTDARVQGAREQQSAAARRQVLDSVLDGATNAGNARNRFIKALRKAGYRDTIIRPDEQASIDRYFGAREAFVEQDPDVLPSAPNEMGDVVPQKQEGEAPKPGKPQRTNENRSFRLTPPPSTDDDVAAQQKAQAKRERKAEGQETQEPPPVEESTTGGKQGILFTKKGQPAAQADQERPAPKPRKAKVKAKVGEQEVELEVDNADEKIAAMKKDVDKYEAFVACLRKK